MAIENEEIQIVLVKDHSENPTVQEGSGCGDFLPDLSHDLLVGLHFPASAALVQTSSYS